MRRQIPLSADNSVLLESGLDSLGFAILVVRLEETLGYDPFVLMSEPVYPKTFGEFLDIYEGCQPKENLTHYARFNVRHFPPDTTLWISATGAPRQTAGDIVNYLGGQRVSFVGRRGFAPWLSGFLCSRRAEAILAAGWLCRPLFALASGNNNRGRHRWKAAGVLRPGTWILESMASPPLVAEGLGCQMEHWGRTVHEIDPARASSLHSMGHLPTSGTIGHAKTSYPILFGH